MKKFFSLTFFLTILLSLRLSAQTLNVPLVIQEQNQWCWSACSKCILDYFGDTLYQCDIAEYARTSITWTSFGTVNCCVDPNQGCNYWNYNYGSTGSIQDILVHFDNVQNYGVAYAISTSQINTEITGGRPFVIRWGWTSGGGHFIVGHGIDTADNVSYMNPWPGEGFHIAPYSWVLADGVHNWTHTNVLTSAPLNVEENNTSSDDLSVYPNPFGETATVQYSLTTPAVDDAHVEVQDMAGRVVYTQPVTDQQGSVQLGADLSEGVYLARVVNGGEVTPAVKIVKGR